MVLYGISELRDAGTVSCTPTPDYSVGECPYYQSCFELAEFEEKTGHDDNLHGLCRCHQFFGYSGRQCDDFSGLTILAMVTICILPSLITGK
jgi:hypothetical protein